MLLGMAWAMAGRSGSARALAIAAGLIAVSIVLAPMQRRGSDVWDHILDLWAMAGLLLAGLAAVSRGPASAASDMPAMRGMAMPVLDALPLAVAIEVGWALLRLRSIRAHARKRGEGRPLVECIITAGVTGAGLLVMTVA